MDGNGFKRDLSPIELEPYSHDREDAPFLGSDDGDREGPARISHDEPTISHGRVRHASRWQVTSPSGIIMLAAFVKFLIVLTGLMIMMPMYRLIEDTLCHVHYNDDSLEIIDEMKCKTDEIQAELAYMLGWFGLVNAIFKFGTAYPYGVMADSIGRKPVILIAYVGQIFAFVLVPVFFGPMKMVIRRHPYILMIDVVFTLFGGGVPVLLSTFFAIASDVSADKDKTNGFLYLTLGTSAGGLLGPLLAGILMSKYGPWVPVYVTLFSIPIVFTAIMLVPETLVKKTNKDAIAKKTFKDQISSGIKELSSAVKIMRDPNVLLVLTVFFFSNPRVTAETTTLTQYVSKNFGWTLAQTSILLSPLGVVAMIVLALLPKLSELITSRDRRCGLGFSTFRKDLFLLRISMLLLSMASLFQGLSLHVVPFMMALFIATLGSADSPLARATVSHFVDGAYTSRLYALIGMVEVVGSFTGGPVLAWFFEKGMKIKGIFTGLPFFYVSFLCFLTFTALLLVRPPATKVRDEEIFSDDGESAENEPLSSNAIRLN